MGISTHTGQEDGSILIDCNFTARQHTKAILRRNKKLPHDA